MDNEKLEITFDGRYGEQRKDDYISYCFKGVKLPKLHELFCCSSPIGHPWGEATLVRRNNHEEKSLIIDSSEYGYFISSNDENLISCWDEGYLHKIICPDDIEFPLGSVVPVDIAWEVIKVFVETGKLSNQIKWISWEDIPDNANWTYDKMQ